jgi:sugar lactone lactonase YvrE
MPMQRFVWCSHARVTLLFAIALAACGGGSQQTAGMQAAAPMAGSAAPLTAAAGSSGIAGSAAAAQPNGVAGKSAPPAAGTSAPATAGADGVAGQSAAAAGKPAQVMAGAAAPAAGSGGAAGTASKTVLNVYWLDILGNTVWRANEDGSQAKALVMGNGISAPDGIGVDLDGGHVYWTNMGSAVGGANNGTVQRATLDGKMVETIVPAGVGNTFKQMTIDRTHNKLYWCDREGAKVWRSDFDGKNHEVLASGHDFNQLVGIALDVERAQFYFTDRLAKKIMRAGFALPANQTAANRSDIEVLFEFSGNSMPIDLDLDLEQRKIYWTDRGLGTVQRAAMDLPAGQTSTTRSDKETLISNVGEPIGIAIDHEHKRLFFGNVAGQLERANLDGSELKMIGHSSSVTGVTVVYAPPP